MARRNRITNTLAIERGGSFTHLPMSRGTHLGIHTCH